MGILMKSPDSGTPAFMAPPTPGRDTQAVLGELPGHGPERIEALRETLAIG